MVAKKDRWAVNVKTDSIHPPQGLFTKSAATTAHTRFEESLTERPRSGIRMLRYFIHRRGRGLRAKRRAELEKAKPPLQANRTSTQSEKRRIAARLIGRFLSRAGHESPKLRGCRVLHNSFHLELVLKVVSRRVQVQNASAIKLDRSSVRVARAPSGAL